MDWSPIVLIEVVLVFGSVLAWGGWELWMLRRDKAPDAPKQAQGLPDGKAAVAEPHGPGPSP